MPRYLRPYRPFDCFDTVEVSFYDNEKIRGYIIYYDKTIGCNTFDAVIIVFNKNDSPSFLGSALNVNLCRMVLFEKFDYKREYAFETMTVIEEG